MTDESRLHKLWKDPNSALWGWTLRIFIATVLVACFVGSWLPCR